VQVILELAVELSKLLLCEDISQEGGRADEFPRASVVVQVAHGDAEEVREGQLLLEDDGLREGGREGGREAVGNCVVWRCTWECA